MNIAALSGGVGGAKLARGLALVLPDGALTVVCNTGDDFEHLGLPISPDLDSVLYAMAGVSDEQRGWGRSNETWSFMEAARQLGLPDWFNLGDKDLALHIARRQLLASGSNLTDVTAQLASHLRVRQRLLPMSNAAVRTRLDTDAGLLDFQDYFVRRRAEPRVKAVHFEGASTAAPPLSLGEWQPQLLIICPSNPFLSIDPILSIPSWRDWLRHRRCPCVAVSPIVGGRALKGCAGKMLREFGLDCNALSIARHYGDVLDGIVIDELDRALLPDIRALNLRAMATQTIMNSDADRASLARAVLTFGETLRT